MYRSAPVVQQTVTIRDLRSRNGVLVNGVPRQEATLQPGDRIMIGSVEAFNRAVMRRSVSRRLAASRVCSENYCINLKPANPGTRLSLSNRAWSCRPL